MRKRLVILAAAVVGALSLTGSAFAIASMPPGAGAGPSSGTFPLPTYAK